MRKLQILGTGCPKCEKLMALTHEAVDSLGSDFEIEKISDIQQIVKFGVMTTPALVVNGEVKVAGRLPSVEEIKKMIQIGGI